MKSTSYLIGLITVCIIALTSCSFNCLPGEGAIITQEVDIDIITGINLESSVDVELRYGKNQFIEVTGHQNHISLLKKKVSGNSWSIDFTENVCTNDFKVKVTLPDFERVMINGSGHVRSGSPLKVDDLELGISGSGSIDVQVSASSIDVTIDGSGDVILKGNCQNLEAELHGSGNLNAREIEVEDVEIAIDGSGDATVNASDKLDASIKGSGSIKYLGSPKVRSSIKGSGEVIKD